MSYRLRATAGTSARAPGSHYGRLPVFNELLWALTVSRTDAKFPLTASLLNLQGIYTNSWNVVAAGALIAVVPTTIVLLAFQRHLVSGLLVGANK